MMNAVGLRDSHPVDHPEALMDVQVPVPEPGPRDLLVEVRAVSVNPIDVKVRMRSGAQDEPKVLGYDAAGVVRAVGSEVTLFAPGDEVYYAGDMTRPGTNSELHTVDERVVGRKPTSLDFAEAAGLPLTAITAWESLFDRLGASSDSSGTLLVLGGAGGVGSMLIQLAARLTDLTVVATASRPESRAWVTELGADHVVDHREPLAAQLQAISPDGVELVFSAYTSGREAELAQLMAPQSHLVLIDDPTSLDVTVFKGKSIAVHWESMFTRSMFRTPDMVAQHELLTRVADLVDDATVRTTVSETLHGLDAATVLRAHAMLEEGHVTGKVVITQQ